MAEREYAVVNPTPYDASEQAERRRKELAEQANQRDPESAPRYTQPTNSGTPEQNKAVQERLDAQPDPGPAGPAPPERDALLNAYANAPGRPAPTVARSGVAPTVTAAPTTVGPASTAAGANAIAPDPAQVVNPRAVNPVAAPQMQAAAPVNARTVQAGHIGPVSQMTAANVNPTTQAKAVDTTAATIDQGPQAQARAQTQRLLGSYEDAIAGRTGPSVAELQLRRGNDAAISQQHAAVAGVRGSQAAAAQRAAGRNIAGLMQQQATDQALVRAQETNAMRDRLLSGYESTRGADIGLASTQAGFEQQAGMQRAQLGTQVNLTNAGAENQRSALLAGYEQQARGANQQAMNTAGIETARLEQGANIAGAEIGTRVDLANQGVQQQTNLTNANLTAQQQQQNQQIAAQLSMLEAQLGTNVNLANSAEGNRMRTLLEQFRQQNNQFNAQQLNEFTKLQAQLSQQNSQFNAGQTNQGNQFQAGVSQRDNLADLDARLKAQGLDDNQRAMLLNAYLTMRGQDMGATAAANATGVQSRGQDYALAGGIVGAGATVGAAALASGAGGNPTAPPPTQPGGGPQPVTTGAPAGAPPYDPNAPLPLQTSDRRAKTRIALLDSYKEPDDEVGELLDKLKPATYRYKEPDEPGSAPGKRYGVMAQDLEKSDMGRSIVREEGGVKKIDTNQAVGVLLASMAKMHDKMKKRKAA